MDLRLATMDLGLQGDRLRMKSIHSAAELFAKTELQLSHTLDLDGPAVSQLLADVADRVAPAPKTGGELLRERQNAAASFLATGLPTVDSALQGGFFSGMITELVGPAGVGKTQACLTAAAAAILPRSMGGLGESAGVVYIDTEHTFNAERLAEIAEKRWPQYYGAAASNGAELRNKLLSQVWLFTVENSEELLERIQTLEPFVVEHNVKLIVIDSIAAPCRRDFAREEAASRGEALVKQAAALKHLADVCSVVVLCSNQVMGRVSDNEDEEDSPALGNTWHHCVSNRIRLHRHPNFRELVIAKSPLAPRASLVFTVQVSGLQEVELDTGDDWEDV